MFLHASQLSTLIAAGPRVRYPVWQHTFVSPSAFSRRAVVSYWRKYVHEVLVNRLGGLSLPRKSVVRLTDRPDMTLDVYRGRKTTIQPTKQVLLPFFSFLYKGIFVTPFRTVKLFHKDDSNVGPDCCHEEFEIVMS